MTHRCIKPICEPLNCSDCNCAIPEDVYTAVWQAATMLERERAALVCEQRAAYYDTGDDDRPSSRRASGANACAAAIRAG